MLYLDASAWVKRYERERGTDWMDAVWGSGLALASSPLGLVEVASAIARRHATQGIAPGTTQQTLARTKADYLQFAHVDFDRPVQDLAFALAAKHRLRGADAVHLASAVSLREDIEGGATLVASDAQLLAAALAEGLSILDPQTNPPLPSLPM